MPKAKLLKFKFEGLNDIEQLTPYVEGFKNCYIDNNGHVKEIENRSRYIVNNYNVTLGDNEVIPIAIISYQERPVKQHLLIVLAKYDTTNNAYYVYLYKEKNGSLESVLYEDEGGSASAGLKVDSGLGVNFDYAVIWNGDVRKTVLYFTIGGNVYVYYGGSLYYKQELVDSEVYTNLTYLKDLPGDALALENHNGYLYIGTNDYLLWSDPEHPDNINSLYNKYIGEPIRRLISIDRQLYIFTNNSIWVMDGLGSTFRFRKLLTKANAIWKTAVAILGTVFFYGEDGRLYTITGQEMSRGRVENYFRDAVLSVDPKNSDINAFFDPARKWYVTEFYEKTKTKIILVYDFNNNTFFTIEDEDIPYIKNRSISNYVDREYGTLTGYMTEVSLPPNPTIHYFHLCRMYHEETPAAGINSWLILKDLFGKDSQKINLRKIRLTISPTKKVIYTGLYLSTENRGFDSIRNKYTTPSGITFANEDTWQNFKMYSDIEQKVDYGLNKIGRSIGMQLTWIGKLKGIEFFFKKKGSSWS